jgi:hypothetical protein
MMDFNQIIKTLPFIIVGCAAAVSLISFVRHYPSPLQKLSLLWVLNFGVDLAAFIVRKQGYYNLWLYNIYFWIMYLVLAHLYGTQIKSRGIQQSIRWFYGLFPMLVVVQVVTGGIMELQSPVIAIGGVFIVFLLAAYLRQLYLSEDTNSITGDPWFWFSIGFLIYYGGTVPFFGMMNFLWAYYPVFTNFYYKYFCNLFIVLLNLLVITGFLCRRNYQKSL